MKNSHPTLYLIGILLWLTGCATRLPAPAVSGGAIELDDVPFNPQEQYQCGPAALATLLQWNGVEISAEQLAPTLMIPERQGSLQIELLAQTRVQGRVPFVLRGDMDDLLAELRDGHPVLVLQNLAFDWKPVWHYAVVVGMDPQDKTLVLRSGRERRHVVSLKTFEHTWARSQYWGMLVMKPGELPVSVDAQQVLAAVTPFEQAARWDIAVAVYQSAVERWPEQIVFYLGVASSYYAQGDLRQAELAYRNVIAAFPHDAVAYNNLALVLAESKRWDEAEHLVRQALLLGGVLREEFLDTQRQIRCRRSVVSNCDQ